MGHGHGTGVGMAGSFGNVIYPHGAEQGGSTACYGRTQHDVAGPSYSQWCISQEVCKDSASNGCQNPIVDSWLKVKLKVQVKKVESTKAKDCNESKEVKLQVWD